MINRYRSEKIGSLAGALSKAQVTYKQLYPNQDGPRGKYANLDATLLATRESLAQNGLCFFQTEEIAEDNSAILLVSTVAHESNEYICSITWVTKGIDGNVSASFINNCKRRHAQQLLGFAPSINDPMSIDDYYEKTSEQLVMQNADVYITDDQYQELLIDLEGHKEILKDILSNHDIRSLKDLPASEYHKVHRKIRRLKQIEDEYERKR